MSGLNRSLRRGEPRFVEPGNITRVLRRLIVAPPIHPGPSITPRILNWLRAHIQQEHLAGGTIAPVICRLCRSGQVVAKAIDGRERYRCLGCSQHWYSRRESSTATDQILDGIADAVVRSGVAEERSVVMVNYVWRDGYRKQLQQWCQAHNFDCTKVFRSGSPGTRAEQYLRFTRAQ
jgi:hypothetical protein